MEANATNNQLAPPNTLRPNGMLPCSNRLRLSMMRSCSQSLNLDLLSPKTSNTHRSNEALSPSVSSSARLDQFDTSRRFPEPQRNIRPGFDAKKMWKKAKSIFNTLVRLKKLQDDVQMYGTMNEPTSVAIENAQLRQKTLIFTEKAEEKRPCYIIYPDSFLKHTWNIILAIILLYTAIVMPVRLVFYDKRTLGWEIVERIIEALFWMDILVNFFSAYNDTDGTLVTDLKQIVIKYLKGWFIFDLIACFPFEFIISKESTMLGHYNSLLRLFRLPRLYRLIKVGKLFGALKVMSADGVLEYGDLFIYNASFVRLVVFVLTMFTFAHWFGCLWYATAKIASFSEDTWVVRMGIQDRSIGTHYLFSLYWAVTTMYTIGYGDISGGTTAIMWMVGGAGLFTTMIGTLSQLLSAVDSKHASLTKKLSVIAEFCNQSKLSTELRQKMQKALCYNAENEGFLELNKNEIFEETRPDLKWKVIMEMHSKVVTQIPFFLDCPKSLIAQIVPNLQPFMASEETILYYWGDVPYEIKGKVDMLIEHTNWVFKSFIKGSYFGEIEVIERTPRICTVKARDQVDLLILHKKLYHSLIESEFPEVAQKMRDLAAKRHKDIDKTLSAAKAIVFRNGEVLKQDIKRTKDEIDRFKYSSAYPAKTMNVKPTADEATNVDTIAEKSNSENEEEDNRPVVRLKSLNKLSKRPTRLAMWKNKRNSVLARPKPSIINFLKNDSRKTGLECATCFTISVGGDKRQEPINEEVRKLKEEMKELNYKNKSMEDKLEKIMKMVEEAVVELGKSIDKTEMELLVDEDQRSVLLDNCINVTDFNMTDRELLK